MAVFKIEEDNSATLHHISVVDKQNLEELLDQTVKHILENKKCSKIVMNIKTTQK